MHRALRALALIAIPAALLHACGAPAPPNVAPRTDRALLARAEFERNEYQTAYDAVFALRRTWLVERAPDRMYEATSVVVYLDDMKLGGPNVLRDIPIATVDSIRFHDGTAAYARWGLGHDRGVIFVTSRRAVRRPPTPSLERD